MGTFTKTPPLGIGQEVLSGGYVGSVLVNGPGTYSGDRSLSADEILEFSTDQQVDSQGPGILSESLMVYSVGSPSSGVTCGSDSLDVEGANFSKSAYCEYAGVSTMFMTDALNYHSAGGISQGDTELPDSLAMDVSSSGNGYGSFAAGSRSLIGIGNTTALGYVHTTSEKVGASWELCGEWEDEVELVCFICVTIFSGRFSQLVDFSIQSLYRHLYRE